MVIEKELVKSPTMDEMQAAQAHNAKIQECYERLKNDIDNQFAKASTIYSPVNTVFAPIQESKVAQRPNVTEFVRSETVNSVFTADKYDRFTMPTQGESVAELQVATIKEQGYSLSPLAKILAAAFGVVVAGMLTLACINTQTIQNNSIRLQNLEEKRQQLIEKNEEIQRRIEKSTSEDTIRQYAAENGMIKLGE